MVNGSKPDTVLLIHGLYLTHHSWEGWIARYEQRGMKVLAPGWPGMEGPVDEQRRHTTAIANMRVEDVIRGSLAPMAVLTLAIFLLVLFPVLTLGPIRLMGLYP